MLHRVVRGRGLEVLLTGCLARWPGSSRCHVPFVGVWVERLALRCHGPGDMQEFAGCGTPSDLWWLAVRAEPLVEDFDHGVMLRRAQRGEIYGTAQAGISAVPNRRSATDAGPRTAYYRDQPGIASGLLGGPAGREVERRR